MTIFRAILLLNLDFIMLKIACPSYKEHVYMAENGLSDEKKNKKKMPPGDAEKSVTWFVMNINYFDDVNVWRPTENNTHSIFS